MFSGAQRTPQQNRSSPCRVSGVQALCSPLDSQAPRHPLWKESGRSFTGKCVCAVVSVVSHSAAPWTVNCQAPLSMGFSRQEHRSGLPCPPPGDLPDPGIEPVSLTSRALTGGFLTTRATWGALSSTTNFRCFRKVTDPSWVSLSFPSVNCRHQVC